MTTLDDLPSTAARTLPLAGELDLDAVPEVRRQLHELVDAGVERLHLDFTDVAFIDSRGLGVLIGIARRLHEAGGALVVSHPTPAVQRVFEVTRLDQCQGITVRR